MAYASATTLTADQIPVIDLAGLQSHDAAALGRVAAELTRAASEVGFFYVSGHGVPQALIEATLQSSREFFAAPIAEKEQVQVDRHHRGFLRVGEASMYEGAWPDLKESFIWGRETAPDDPDFVAGGRLLCPNNWPASRPQLRATLLDYLAAVERCGQRLLRAFAVSLGAPVDYFAGRFYKPVSRGAIIYYPPQPEHAGVDRFGVAPHTDFGTLTMLYQDGVGGLQVQGRDGQWLTATPVEGTFVVNVGDLLARWSNDRFRSTPHRVVNASGRARYTAAVFVDPDWDTRIEPLCGPGQTPRYPPIGCAEYITGRFDEAFAYRK